MHWGHQAPWNDESYFAAEDSTNISWRSLMKNVMVQPLKTSLPVYRDTSFFEVLE